MSTTQKEEFKQTLIQIIREDKAFFRQLVLEVFQEESNKIKSEEEQRFETILEGNLKKYDRVLKALS